MKKLTIKKIKRLVELGLAEDITNGKDRKEIKERYTLVGIATGCYGVNAKLFQGESGQLYAITKRTTALYIF